MGAAFMAHDVPMCRQRIDPAEWQQEGGAELGSAEEWSDRVCGMASLRMILLALGQDAPSLTELVKAAVAIGAFSDMALLHASVAELAACLGVRSQAEGGYELGQADPLILFRDPSRWGQEHDRVRLSRLAQSYAGRCITFQPVPVPATTAPGPS